MAQKALPGEKTLLQIASEGLGYEDIQTSDDLKKLADSGIVKEWVLPIVTGASAETEDYKPGILDAALTIPFGGGVIKTAGKAIGKVPGFRKAVTKLGKKWKQLTPIEKEAERRVADPLGVKIRKRIAPYLPKKVAELEHYGKELLVPEKNLPSHLKREVAQSRAFAKTMLTNKKGMERFLNTVFIPGQKLKNLPHAGLKPEELKRIKDYIFNTRRGRNFQKQFKSEISNYIDSVPYYDMYDLTMRSKTQGLFIPRGAGAVYTRTAKKKLGITTESSISIKVHEFIHAGQLGSTGHMESVMGNLDRLFGGGFYKARGALPKYDWAGDVIRYSKAEIKMAKQDWLDYKKIFLGDVTGAHAVGKAKGKMTATKEIAKLSGGRMSMSKDVVMMDFQMHLKKGRRKGAKVFEKETEVEFEKMTKRQVFQKVEKGLGLKKGSVNAAKGKHTKGFLGWIKQHYADAKTVIKKKNVMYNKYVGKWWETTARINEMRYAEFIGKDPRKTRAYKELRRIYDDDFIDDLNKYYWAAVPVAGVGLSNKEIIDSYKDNE